MKKQNRSWRNSYYNAVMAHMAAENAPRGSLAKKHAGQIALRNALQTQSIWRAERIKKALLISGVVGLIAIVASNWPG